MWTPVVINEVPTLHSITALAGSLTATTVIASSSTVAARQDFRQSSTDSSMKPTIIVLTNHSDMILDELAIDIAGICLPVLKMPKQSLIRILMTTAKSKEIVSGLSRANTSQQHLRRRCVCS